MSEAPPVGRVLRIVAGTYLVEQGDEVRECVLAGRLKQGRDKKVSVGDRVELELLEDGSGRITGLRPRRSELTRKEVGREGEQIIAVNVDQVAAVFSLREPPPDLRMLDRLLALAELNGLDGLVVLNKLDLLEEGDDEAADLLARVREVYGGAEYPVLETSVPDRTGLDELARRLRERISVLAGPSGTGKSSLLNALVPGLDRRVGEVSERVGRGRHTTVNATLIPLPEGGYVADTPGLQYLALWSLPPDELAGAFPEFRPFLGGCKFNDCRHMEEPGCRIREAVDGGHVAESRFESYRSLLEEAEEQATPW